MSTGALMISFDFELAWGTRRSARKPDHAAGIERVADVVRGLLDIFERHNISATWATVGHLMITEEQCLQGRFNYRQPGPEPEWFDGGWFDGIPGLDDPTANRYYAPQLVKQIVTCPVHQELASHTFSHVIMADPSCTEEIAQDEFAKCRELGHAWGRQIQSVVFPRNQIGHLEVLERTGHRCFRAANSEWYWFGTVAKPPQNPLVRKATGLVVRALRLVDERLAICPPVLPARKVGNLWELPHSMFYPGSAGVSRFSSPNDHWRRGAKGLQKATELGRIFSLYTHPHNFLPNPEPHLRAFELICEEAARLRDEGSLHIKTMGEVADDLDEGRNLNWAA
jgi:hypothetical protein